MENSNSFGKQRDTFVLLQETDILSLSHKRHAEFESYVCRHAGFFPNPEVNFRMGKRST
jgi:hypothetical protein